MYNENQKLDYIENCKYDETTLEVIKGIFNSTELTEEKWGLDLCYFNRPQIIDMLKSLNSTSPNRLKSMCVYLADYYNWCLVEKHYVSDLINYYHFSLSDKMIQDIIPKEELIEKYFTKEQLVINLEKVSDASNRFLAYAIYCGIKGNNFNELINIKMSDFNKDTKSLKLITNREVVVDDLFYDLMVKADNQEEYYPDGVIKDNDSKTNTYIQTGYVLKPCRVGEVGTPVDPRILASRFRYIKAQIGNEYISVTTLYKNGMINYIKQQYAKQGIDLRTAILKPINNKLYRYDGETQKYIEEFNSKMTVRMLRREIEYYLEYL